MGGSPTLPALATIPEVKTAQELKGKTLAVDAVTTGYAFVLFDLLKRSGIAVERLQGRTNRGVPIPLARHART
jgi:ABC-type nitrate/sulfonate/bicarbonate transport system substrate-binding protein